MKRSIIGFEQDEVADWVAILDCGHRQHVRHNPPLVSRPWVLSEDGRRSQLAQPLDCLRCERFELPAHFQPYRKTPVFTEQSVPAALLKSHTTRRGVWAKIHVLEGRLRYGVEGRHRHPACDRHAGHRGGRDAPPRGRGRSGALFVEFHADPAREPQR